MITKKFKRILCFGDSFIADTQEGTYPFNIKLYLESNNLVKAGNLSLINLSTANKRYHNILPGELPIEHQGHPGGSVLKTYLEFKEYNIEADDFVIVVYSYAGRTLDSYNNPIPGPNLEDEDIAFHTSHLIDINFLKRYYLDIHSLEREVIICELVRHRINLILENSGATFVNLEVGDEHFQEYSHKGISFPGISLETFTKDLDGHETDQGHDGTEPRFHLNHMDTENNKLISDMIINKLKETT